MNNLLLQSLSKAQLVEALRRRVGRVGDTARTSKEEYITQVLALGEEEVGRIIAEVRGGGAALIAGSVPMAPVAPTVPAATSVPEVQPRVVKKATLGELFGIRGKTAKFEVSVWNDPAAPEADPHWKWDAKKLHSFASKVERGRFPWLAGPAGTGKTEFCKNFCAKTGRAFVRVSLDSGIERYELIGGERVRAGNILFQDGIILRAFRRAGTVILLDEVSIARPEYLAALHAPLDGSRAVTIPETGEVVRAAEGVVFAAADNSNGRGDVSGNYSGVREMNLAFLNRFAGVIRFDYMEADMESKIIAERTGCPVALANLIVGFLAVCRAAADKAQLDSPPSLREAFYWAEALLDGSDYRLAFEEAIVNRAAFDVQEQLQQLYKANVSEAAIDAAFGIAPPPAAAPAPAPSDDVIVAADSW